MPTEAKEATVAEINAAFAKAARSGPLKGIIKYSDEPIVSTDIQRDPHSCIFDSELTMPITTEMAGEWRWLPQPSSPSSP